MPDPWLLFAVVVVLYLHDCVVWHRRGHTIYFGRPGHCRAVTEPMLSLGVSGGLSFVDPLPPLGTAFRVEGSAFKLAPARESLDHWQTATRPLRFVCNLLFVVFFAGAFLLCWFDAWAAWWPAWVAAGAPLWLGAMLLSAAARVDLAGLSVGKAFVESLVLIASPMTAIRAIDRTSERLFIDQHPLLAARLLCDENEFARLVRQAWFAANTDEDTQRAVRRLLRDAKQEAILSDVPACEAGAQSYCPACWAQYTTLDAECRDCGVRVVRF
jgi:hypothetical protein